MFNKMIKLTYSDYINYLKIKFNDFQVTQILPEDMPVYQKIKARLEDASSLPPHILNASLLDSVDLDKETLQAVAEIKTTIAPLNTRLSNFIEFLSAVIKQIFLTRLKAIDIIGTSTILLLISVLSLLSFLGIDVNGNGTINIPLIGVAGGNPTNEMVVDPLAFIYVGLISVLLAMLLLFFGKDKK